MEQLIINGSALDGVYMTEKPGIVIASKRVSWLTVPGRDGRLAEDDGVDYAQVKMKIYIAPGTDAEEAAAALADAETVAVSGKGWFWKVLAFDSSASLGEWMQWEDGGLEGSVSWRCDPYRYLDTGTETMTVSGQGIYQNPGTADALPRITIIGGGDLTLMIGSSSLIFDDLVSGTVIDCAEKTAIDADGSSVTPRLTVEGGWPVFNTGSVAINWSGRITSLQIIPRWRNR